MTRTITSNTELQMLSYKTPACVTAFNWNCCSMFFAISQPRSKSCLMESIQRVTEINHHILNEPSAMERIYIFLFKDNTKTNTNTLTMKTYTISWVSVSWLNALVFFPLVIGVMLRTHQYTARFYGSRYHKIFLCEFKIFFVFQFIFYKWVFVAMSNIWIEPISVVHWVNKDFEDILLFH